MEERKYLDQEGIKLLWSKISMEDYPNNETLIAVLNAIDQTKADKTEIPTLTSQLENDSNFMSEEQVNSLFKSLSSNLALGFYCIEDVTVVVNDVSTVYPANSNVEIKFLGTDIWEIIPTSDNSILTLNAFPGALRTYYPWLEGVKQFSNILFDMNNEDFYSKWSQGNQGAYQVQFAQYINCIFWSDNPYISDVAKRTNYTLYYTSQLPLCYSSIPDNTFKAFYLAFNVTSDPNWGNKAYRDSFAKATWATQAFSYYGARTIGIFGHDDPDFNITLPADCRGLMYAATAIENAGVFDAINTTNFGAKSGSWRDAFGHCSSLQNLSIKNLKVNLNVSWSPLNYDSIYFIISKAANTKAITISVSPHTYNLLSQADFDLAASKNITIELLTTNYIEDKRLSEITNKADKEYVDEKITELINAAPETLDTLGELATAFQENKEVIDVLNEAITNKADKEDIIPADWNQNDSNALDYVKNRTHWIEEETELVIAETTETENLKILNDELFSGVYRVVVDGVSYTCESYLNHTGGETSLGDSRLYNTNDESNPIDVPFMLVSFDEPEDNPFFGLEAGYYATVFYYPDSESHTIKIEKLTDNSTYHPLDENFIPETIARKEYVDELNSAKKDKDLIVTYAQGSTFGVTHSAEEIYEAIQNGTTVYFQKGTELLNLMEITPDYATFFMFYINMDGEPQQKVVVISSNSIMLDQDDTYNYATTSQLNNKADKTALNSYYNKTEVDNLLSSAGGGVSDDVLLKTAQTLTDAELAQVRDNLKFIGKDVAGQTFTIDGEEVVASANAEIFGDYDTNIAVGQWSIAEGSGTVAKGRVAHAEGAFSQALNDGCHVEGYGTKATGYWSHAEGEMTIVSSYASHAEGSYTKMPDGSTRYSTAAGYASHTEGGGCHTTGVASHAEGIGTTANGRCAHVEGTYTIASGKAQHVEGIANIEDTEDKYIHIAGNGTSPTNRSNAHTLDWEGNAWYSGDVYVGSINGINKDEGSKKLATEEYVENAISNIENSENTNSVQSDWLQNDNTAPDYIKNRTHWIEQNLVEIMPEFDTGGGTSLDLYGLELFSKLTPNARCMITLDGVVYEAIAYHNAYNAYEWYTIGNTVLIGESGDIDTDLPFGIFIDKFDENWGECSIEVSSFKMDAITNTVVKIPEIYLPAKIGIEGTGSFSEIFNDLNDNIASGDYSRAENFKTTASGYASSAQGLSTIASGYGANAQGCSSEARGAYTHAEGYYTLASGSKSHAEGEGTIASGENQHVSGSYNLEDTDNLIIVGNGTDVNSRSNAYTLDLAGNGWYQGTVEVSAVILRSSTPGSSKKFKLTIDDSGVISTEEVIE